ncbi:unnamed protein product [Durusdinium trenchii]|uniref:Uncharacterized protein n=1 Tax=Durusdinium trenchii TaxID=1381693 RepID=A0ABP0NK53_9DINO
MCFACLPQVHSSTSMATVMKNRRLLEDKLFAVMNSHEISLNYAPPEHGGDRRRTSQQCPSFALSHDMKGMYFHDNGHLLLNIFLKHL